MFLYANGCSMTYGSELADDPVRRVCFDDDYRLRHAWPARLAARLGCTGVHNDAVPSGSNERIVRTTIDWVLRSWLGAGRHPAELLVVVGWSAPMRREFHVGGEWRQVIPYHDYDLPDLNRLVAVYRELAWTEQEAAVRFFTQVVSLQSFLVAHGVRHLFFDAITAAAVTAGDAPEDVHPLVAAVDADRYHRFGDREGDMASVLALDEPARRGGHPSEAGHDRWARGLAAHIEEHRLLGDHRPAPSPVPHDAVSGTRQVRIHDVKVGRAPVPAEAVSRAGRLLRRVAEARRRDPFIYD